jgi:hypothetical protein
MKNTTLVLSIFLLLFPVLGPAGLELLSLLAIVGVPILAIVTAYRSAVGLTRHHFLTSSLLAAGGLGLALLYCIGLGVGVFSVYFSPRIVLCCGTTLLIFSIISLSLISRITLLKRMEVFYFYMLHSAYLGCHVLLWSKLLELIEQALPWSDVRARVFLTYSVCLLITLGGSLFMSAHKVKQLQFTRKTS